MVGVAKHLCCYIHSNPGLGLSAGIHAPTCAARRCWPRRGSGSGRDDGDQRRAVVVTVCLPRASAGGAIPRSRQVRRNSHAPHSMKNVLRMSISQICYLRNIFNGARRGGRPRCGSIWAMPISCAGPGGASRHPQRTASLTSPRWEGTCP